MLHSLASALLLLTGGARAAPPGRRSASSLSPSSPSLHKRIPSAGCGRVPDIEDGASGLYTTRAGREYKLYVPRDYNEHTPAPLIFSYHGAGGNVHEQADRDRLASTEANPDHIVVYLQGNIDDPTQPTRTTWQGAPENHSDDVAYTRDVLDAVEAAYCVDRSRVYATGFSQGGGFVAAQLACNAEVSARFAAYAPVAGAYYQKQVDRESQCAPESVAIRCPVVEGQREAIRVPVMAFHGGSDDTIRYEGGFRNGACLPAVRHFVNTWVAANGLAGAPATNETIDGSSVSMMYGSGGLVTLVYAGDEVGHAWMSKAAGTASFEANEWILAFFRGYALA